MCLAAKAKYTLLPLRHTLHENRNKCMIPGLPLLLQPMPSNYALMLTPVMTCDANATVPAMMVVSWWSSTQVTHQNHICVFVYLRGRRPRHHIVIPVWWDHKWLTRPISSWNSLPQCGQTCSTLSGRAHTAFAFHTAFFIIVQLVHWLQ